MQNYFGSFLFQVKTLKFVTDIYWPLGAKVNNLNYCCQIKNKYVKFVKFLQFFEPLCNFDWIQT